MFGSAGAAGSRAARQLKYSRLTPYTKRKALEAAITASAATITGRRTVRMGASSGARRRLGPAPPVAYVASTACSARQYGRVSGPAHPALPERAIVGAPA